MDMFATELWIRIIECLQKRNWLVLSMTCRMFREVAQEQLYRDVHLEGSGQKNADDMLFARSLGAYPPFAGLVCTLICGPIPPRGARTIPTQSFTSSATLSKISTLVNLRALELRSTIIDEDLCAAIQTLPRLQQITFCSCTIDPGLGARQIPIMWGPHLSTVIIRHLTADAESWSAIIPPNIRSLELQPSSDVSLASSEFRAGILFVKLMERPQSLQLTELIFTITIPSNIDTILVSCPNLRRCSFLTSYDTDLPALRTLPFDAIPLLEYFAASSNYIEAFVSGRSIQSADISISHEDSDDILLGLRRSLVPITKLAVIAGDTKVKWVECAPLTLRTLEVHQWHGHHYSSTSELSWLAALSRMTELSTLRVCGPRFSPTQQAELVDAAAAVCDSLREFRFEAWEEEKRSVKHKFYTWRWRKEAPWELYTHLHECE